MSEEELCREIKSGAFSMQIADCERNIRIQFEQLQQENKKYKEVIDKAIEYIEKCLKQTPIENRTKTDDTLDIEYEYILKILKEVE